MNFRTRPAGQEENLTPLIFRLLLEITNVFQVSIDRKIFPPCFSVVSSRDVCFKEFRHLRRFVTVFSRNNGHNENKKNTEPPEHLSPHPDEAPPPEKAKPARQLENHPSHCPVGTGPTESLWPPLYLKGLAGSKPFAKIKISYLWVLIYPLKFSFVRSEPPPPLLPQNIHVESDDFPLFPTGQLQKSTKLNFQKSSHARIMPCYISLTKLFRSNLWIHQRWS